MSDNNLEQLVRELVDKQKELIASLHKGADKKKDFLDKLSSLSISLSGILIALVGGFFTYNYNMHQVRISKVQTVADFMPYLSKTDESKDLAIEAISVLDTELSTRLGGVYKRTDALVKIAVSGEEKDRRLVQESLGKIAVTGNEQDRNAVQKAIKNIYPSAAEAFFLDQRNIRRLDNPRFQKKVYIYVGDIHDPEWKPTNVYIMVDDETRPAPKEINKSNFLKNYETISNDKKWKKAIRRQGEFITFHYAGQDYNLTVKQILAVAIGTDTMAFEIIEAT